MEDIKEIFETITMTESIGELNDIIKWCEDRKAILKYEQYNKALNILYQDIEVIARNYGSEESPFYDCDKYPLNWNGVLYELETYIKNN